MKFLARPPGELDSLINALFRRHGLGERLEAVDGVFPLERDTPLKGGNGAGRVREGGAEGGRERGEVAVGLGREDFLDLMRGGRAC
jgi:hypothetical protein